MGMAGFLLYFLFAGTCWLVNTSELLPPPTEDVYALVNHSIFLVCSVKNSSLISNENAFVWTQKEHWLTNETVGNDTSIRLIFERVSYQDRGVYVCWVYNVTARELATPVRRVSLNVGEMPQQADRPTLDAIGWPPQSTLSWKIKEAHVKSQVYLSYTSPSNRRCDFSKKYFHKIPNCGRVSKYKNQSFKCSGTDFVQKMLDSGAPQTSTFLCAIIKTWNSYGESFSKPIVWNLNMESRCPKPWAFQVVRTGESDIIVSWEYPHGVDSGKYRTLQYRLILQRVPELDDMEVKEVGRGFRVNATYHESFTELKCGTKYRVRIACVFEGTYDDNDDWGEETSFVTRTKARAWKWLKEICVGMFFAAPYLQVNVRSTFREKPWSSTIEWDKLPHNGTWCGKLLWVWVRYWRVFPSSGTNGTVLEKNVSGLAAGITLQGLDVYGSYDFTVNMCSEVGCADYGTVYTLLVQEKDISTESTARWNTGPGAKMYPTVLGSTVGGVVLVTAVLIFASVVWKRSRRPGPVALENVGGDVLPDAQHDEMSLTFPKSENDYDDAYAVAGANEGETAE